MSKTLSGVQEVSSYLRSIGREDCFHAVVQQGFYTSMDALRGTTYEELVECGVRQAHAKLIVSSLGSGAAVSALAGVPAATELDEVAAFLRSVGLENCPPAKSNACLCPTSAPAPPQGAPGGTGRLGRKGGQGDSLDAQPMPRPVEPASKVTPTAFAHPGQQTVKAAGFENIYQLAEASMQVVQPHVLEAAALCARGCTARGCILMQELLRPPSLSPTPTLNRRRSCSRRGSSPCTAG